MARQSNRLGPPGRRPQLETLADLTDEVLLARVHDVLERLLGGVAADGAVRVAHALLDPERMGDVEGMRALLYQMTRNRDPEMQANHLTELRVAAALSTVEKRRVEVERLASGRNERRVDFALEDGDATTLVEVKNLNAPLIKKATDPLSEALRASLAGTAARSDMHVVYLFFRRPRPDELPRIEAGLRDAWLDSAEMPHGTHVFLVPPQRPRVAALVIPARPDTGGRVIVYDHGQHLHAAPGNPIRVVHHERHHLRRPRERLEELFVKDNILRRLQDAEQKFPLGHEALRVVLFCQGAWAPVAHVDRCLDESIRWYVEGQASEHDLWAAYYPHWAARWSFTPLRNIDAVLAVRPLDEPAPVERIVDGGDVRFSVREVWSRQDGLVERVFDGPTLSRQGKWR